MAGPGSGRRCKPPSHLLNFHLCSRESIWTQKSNGSYASIPTCRRNPPRSIAPAPVAPHMKMPDPVVEQLSLFLNEPLVDSPIQQGAYPPIQCDQTCIEMTGEVSTTVVSGNAIASLANAEDQDVSAQNIPSPTVNVGDGWIEFMLEHGRVPMIADVKKPWEYSGWLLYYRLLLEEHPEIGKRWGYWWRTKVAGTILDEPIPPIEFRTTNDTQAGLELFDSWISIVARYHSHWSAVNALLDWFLWGFGLIKQPPVFPVELNEALYRNVNLGP